MAEDAERAGLRRGIYGAVLSWAAARLAGGACPAGPTARPAAGFRPQTRRGCIFTARRELNFKIMRQILLY